MRRDLAAVGATLTAFATLAGPSTQQVSAATMQTVQAVAALRYLYGHVAADGDIAGSLGPTEDTVISIADNGYDAATLKAPTGTGAYQYLSGHASTITTAGGAAKYILAWVAAGKPSAIDAGALLTSLNTPTSSGGYLTSQGTFHNASAAIETANAYSQSLSILADVAAGHALPPHATGWLTCAQRADGGFGYAIDDSAATPPAACGDTTSDTNDAAIILQALGAAAVSSADASARTYLHATQQPGDGGFGFVAGGSSDPNSDATVIQALVAIGEDPTGPAWTVAGGGNPLTSLESFADPQGSGGYITPPNPGPDPFTTAGAPQALVLKPYAATTAVTPGASPAAAPTPTPTPTPRPVATPTPGGTLALGPEVPATGASPGGASPGGLAWLLMGGGATLLVAARGRRRCIEARPAGPPACATRLLRRISAFVTTAQPDRGYGGDMPNRFTAVPAHEVPPVGRAMRPVVLAADLFMGMMLSRPGGLTLGRTWVTPATVLLSGAFTAGGALLVVLLASRGGVPALAAAGVVAITCLLSAAVLVVGVAQRRIPPR